MQEYTKFKLKSDAELSSLLESKDDLLVLACNKCFKVFDVADKNEPELDTFIDFAKNQGKKIIHSDRIDFLCNSYRLKGYINGLSSLLGADCGAKLSAVIVIACGIGVQTVAGSLDIPVYTACDTVKESGNHAVSLCDKHCKTCGQCVLSRTNGICPVWGCPKTLLNGQCGGAKDGKCEIAGQARNDENEKACVWDLIEHSKCTVINKIIPKNDPLVLNNNIINKHNSAVKVLQLQRKRSESFYGGLYLKHSKAFSAFLTLEDIKIPQKVLIPMSQHAGMSADPIVKVGDFVKTGQKIGEAVGTLSSSVHASISGRITSISNMIASYRHPNSCDSSKASVSELNNSLCITIESDGKDELHQSVAPIPYWEDLDIYDIDAIIAEKGIVGMGGAGFPTPIKLKAPKPIHTILLNGCESEPYVTADHRIMLEYADDIIKGLQIILKCTNARQGIIVISDNKSDCIHHLEAKTANIDDIFVMALWSKYPQGAERMLISRTLGIKLEAGQRPFDVGAIVVNVSTARAIGDAFTRGMPLIERAVTVSGENVRNPANLMVRIGTPVSEILKYASVAKDSSVILGGPMMGKELESYDIPIIKGTNAVIAVPRRFSCSTDCIKCGRCVDVCPMELLPLYYPVHKNSSNWEKMREYNVSNCIECASCNYICPSRIDIASAVREGKRRLC